ncbi:MAG: transposase [Thiothrix litoralis]
MKKPPIQRRVKQVDTSGQFSLLIPPESDESPPPAPVTSGQPTFVDPNPGRLQVGGVFLPDHLKQCGIKDVFIIRQLLNEQDWSAFEAGYLAGGRHPYAPRAMMGLILHGIMRGQSSLRDLERLACVDLGCWWLTGGIMPDHSVIGRFIQQHEALLTDDFFESLTRSVLKATQSGTSYTAGDGTVVEAAASRYGAVKREALEKQITKAEEHLEAVTDDEVKAAKARSALEQLNKAEAILAEREAKRKANGKDPATTRINPKEAEAVNQPLKGQGYGTAYKPSVIANEQRIILGHAVEPSSETAVVADLIGSAQAQGELEESSWDAGYFCDGVLELEEKLEVPLLIPEGRTNAKNFKKASDKQYPKSHFHYDESTDTYRCPAMEVLGKVGRYRGNANNPAYTEYGTSACEGCSQRKACTRSKKGRRIKRYAGDVRKESMRAKFQDESVQQRYRQRAGRVEPVFSQLKGRQGLNRFRRTGLASVRLEFALHALAYNLGRAVALCFGLIWSINSLKKPKYAIRFAEKVRICCRAIFWSETWLRHSEGVFRRA